MEDNVEMLVMNTLQEFIRDYLGGIVTIDPSAKKNDKVIKSAKVINSGQYGSRGCTNLRD